MMRVLRAVLGCQRYDKKCSTSNVDVRRALGWPSIECLITRRRLKYLATLCQRKPASLWALLGCSASAREHCPLPWVNLVLADLQALYAFHDCKLAQLGPPKANTEAWVRFMVSWPFEWRQLVD
eukprot:9044142-Karenia_brevis.AAC.1